MKKTYFIIIGISALFLISGCTQKEKSTLKPDVLTPREPPEIGTSALMVQCDTYALGEQVGYGVTTNNEAFDILKKYWYTCPGNQPLVEDCIIENMTGDEAIGKEFDPSFKYTSIKLDNGEKIDAWVLNWNYAVDQTGNVYGCYFEQ